MTDETRPGAQRLRDAEVPQDARPLDDILTRLPTNPGVYLMKDHRGKLLYIGKAANLRNRVRQYFQPHTSDSRDFVPLLGSIVADIETVITSNEKEALLLENTLIKRHKPRFNVNLRDDKNYLVLRLDPQAEWPRLEVVRNMKDDRAHYFGPYHSATSCREALRVVNRHFQLRTCTDHVLHNRRRPCLQYQIKRCPAPCVLPVSQQDYAEQVRDVRLFLEGRNAELLDRLNSRMKEAAAALQYERAAMLRDQVQALQSSLQDQKVVSSDFLDQDVIGFHREGMALEIVVVSIRNGKMLGSRTFSFGGQEFPDAEILSTFLGLYYDLNPDPPDEILLPFAIDDVDVKTEWLNELRQAVPRTSGHPGNRSRKIVILVPQRGARHDLVELAHKNALASFVSRRNADKDSEEMLARLQNRLKLNQPPRVIECYDISHVQGTDTVASMVVFVDGRPNRGRYRTYKLHHPGTAGSTRSHKNDDFASMYEVLSRRLRRAREAAESNLDEGDNPWRLPDLIVVDGGKGQLGMALAAARDIGVDTRWGVGLPIIALAKERDTGDATQTATTPDPAVRQDEHRPDRIFLPHAKDPIAIRANSAEMFVLQQLRDEAHRFAVNFHRNQRRRRTLRSALADVPGIGVHRQQILLRHFGSVRKIREASLEDLFAVDGISRKLAQAVHAYFGGLPGTLPADRPDIPSDEKNGVPNATEADEDALDSAFADLDAASDPPASTN